MIDSGPWDHANPVRIELSSLFSQKLRNTVGYCLHHKHYTFENVDFNTCVKDAAFNMVLRETVWGEMSMVTMDSFAVF